MRHDHLRVRTDDLRDARQGGTDGNERLTGSAGATLLVLLAAEGLTVLSLGSLLSLHVFLGVMLIPPVALKIASTDIASSATTRAAGRT